MKIKIFLLLAVTGGILFFCFGNKKADNQKKVDKAVFSVAVETAQKSIKLARAKNSREFVKLAHEYRKNRNGYHECYQLLQNVTPPENSKWNVREDLNNGTINVSCKLDKNRELLIVLRHLPDKSMKFAYACTLNS